MHKKNGYVYLCNVAIFVAFLLKNETLRKSEFCHKPSSSKTKTQQRLTKCFIKIDLKTKKNYNEQQ